MDAGTDRRRGSDGAREYNRVTDDMADDQLLVQITQRRYLNK